MGCAPGPECQRLRERPRAFVNERGARCARAAGCGPLGGHGGGASALIACGVGPGDEVIVQSFTFCASSHPVTYLGATPVFVDSEADTWNMDPELLDRAIADRIARTGRKPKAIVPVALYGMPYRIDRIMEVADKYGIPWSRMPPRASARVSADRCWARSAATACCRSTATR